MEASMCEVLVSPPKFQRVDHFWISLKVFILIYVMGVFPASMYIYVHVTSTSWCLQGLQRATDSPE